MLDTLRELAHALSIAFFGFASGGAWIAAIVAPNTSYDRLDSGRADGHVRALLVSSSSHIAFMLLAASALATLAATYASAIVGALAAAGFFTNRWTLAPKKRGSTPPGVRQRKKTQRVVAVSLTLIFTLVTLVATGLAIARV